MTMFHSVTFVITSAVVDATDVVGVSRGDGDLRTVFSVMTCPNEFGGAADNVWRDEYDRWTRRGRLLTW